MPYARVTVPVGFRIHRFDNSFRDLKQGEIVDLYDIPPAERRERLAAGHLVEVPGDPSAPATETADTGKGAKGK